MPAAAQRGLVVPSASYVYAARATRGPAALGTLGRRTIEGQLVATCRKRGKTFYKKICQAPVPGSAETVCATRMRMSKTPGSAPEEHPKGHCTPAGVRDGGKLTPRGHSYNNLPPAFLPKGCWENT